MTNQTMINPQIMPVPFYGDTVVLVGQNDEPYVAMKPVAENMGLDWKTQTRKLSEKFESTMVIMTMVAEDGKMREMICLPLRKLPAWLYSISPNRVSPELRDKIIRYQEECDDALWDYWTKGVAVRGGVDNSGKRIAHHRLRLSLLKELHQTRDGFLRTAIHEQLADVSQALGLSVPAIETIGMATPETPKLVREFWQAVQVLERAGVAYNHAVAPEIVAVNFVQLADLLLEAGHPLRIDGALRAALWSNSKPRCLYKNKPIHSVITGKTIKCWVFEKPDLLL